MAGGALVVWVGVLALTWYCVRLRPQRGVRRRDGMLIIGGGVVVPTVVLTVLLVYGLAMLPPLVARAPAGSLQVAVHGELFWWRVRYLPPGREPIPVANEIRLPVGEPVQLRFESDNVIHSFWVPSLGGKMDVIPGRVTYLTLTPTQTGVFRGACAEYCGTAHASMAFYVEVMEKDAFARWLERQAMPAQPPAEASARLGEQLFSTHGCTACHTIRGTAAAGSMGPDLTHAGSRLSLAAGVLPNDRDAFRRWIARTDHVKPGVQMPRFDMLPPGDLAALASYLESLQ